MDKELLKEKIASLILKKPAVIVDFINENGKERSIKASSNDGKIELGKKLSKVLVFNTKAQENFASIIEKQSNNKAFLDPFTLSSIASGIGGLFGGGSSSGPSSEQIRAQQQSSGDQLTLAMINASVEKRKGQNTYVIAGVVLVVIALVIVGIIYFKKKNK